MPAKPAEPADHERSLNTRLADREGIAMVLALVDETGTAAPVTDERMLADGAAQAELLETYRAALRPDTDDAAAVQHVVAVFAEGHRPR